MQPFCWVRDCSVDVPCPSNGDQSAEGCEQWVRVILTAAQRCLAEVSRCFRGSADLPVSARHRRATGLDRQAICRSR